MDYALARAVYIYRLPVSPITHTTYPPKQPPPTITTTTGTPFTRSIYSDPYIFTLFRFFSVPV